VALAQLQEVQKFPARTATPGASRAQISGKTKQKTSRASLIGFPNAGAVDLGGSPPVGQQGFLLSTVYCLPLQHHLRPNWETGRFCRPCTPMLTNAHHFAVRAHQCTPIHIILPSVHARRSSDMLRPDFNCLLFFLPSAASVPSQFSGPDPSSLGGLRVTFPLGHVGHVTRGG
jgi:hypothetical protein